MEWVYTYMHLWVQMNSTGFRAQVSYPIRNNYISMKIFENNQQFNSVTKGK